MNPRPIDGLEEEEVEALVEAAAVIKTVGDVPVVGIDTVSLAVIVTAPAVTASITGGRNLKKKCILMKSGDMYLQRNILGKKGEDAGARRGRGIIYLLGSYLARVENLICHLSARKTLFPLSGKPEWY